MVTEDSSSYKRFFAELKRRKVFQVAAVYGAAMFGVLQGADVLVPALHLPESLITVLAVTGLLGFPVALIVAWTYERTSEGLVRTEEAAPGELTQIIEAPAASRWPVGLAAAAGTALLLVGTWLTLGRPAASAGGPDDNSPAATPVSATTSSASIAVLPFADMSEKGDKAYFSDGLSEELIDALARVDGLRVAARTSSFAFRAGGADVRTIADSLGVATVLEGSVRASGDRLKITAQLIQASDGFHLWTETYDRELTDVFEIQEEIADAIVGELLGELGLAGGAGVSVTRTDVEAYEQYLLGRAFVAQRSSLPVAVGHFRRAIEIDSMYAPAWGGLAEVYAVYPYYEDMDIAESRTLAEQAARRTLELDSTSASARIALGSVLRDRFEWKEAEQELLRAIELAPMNAEAHGEYSQYLAYQGRLEEAVEAGDRALELDPLSVHKLGVAGMYGVIAGRDDVGLDRLWRSGGDFQISAVILTQHLLSKGRFDEAARAARLNPTVDDLLTPLVEAVRSPAGSDAHQRGLARVTRNLLADGRGGGLAQPGWLVLLGEPDAALDMLTDLFSAPVLGVEVLWMPLYDPIRDDPRFQAVVEGLNLPD